MNAGVRGYVYIYLYLFRWLFTKISMPVTPSSVVAFTQDIVIANLVWCMSYTREIEGVSYITQQSCDSNVTV